MKKLYPVLMALLICFTSTAQRIISETYDTFYVVVTPETPLAETIGSYAVTVNTPYTLTVEDVNTSSLADFEAEKAAYNEKVAQSEAEYQKMLTDHDGEVEAATKRYDKEMEHFKSLSMLERLALTDQGKKPTLKVPSKPTYIAPSEPKYKEPNLDDYLLFDNASLADDLVLFGYEKGNDVQFDILFTKMEFKENAGKTYYEQPTKLTVTAGGTVLEETVFDAESKFLTESSSNTINLNRYEKQNVLKIMKEIETHVNLNYGYRPIKSSITIDYPKNKKREYDDLELAKNKVISALRKLDKDASLSARSRAMREIDQVKTAWRTALEKVDFRNEKATYNADIAKSIYFNLLRLDHVFMNKTDAETTLSELQGHMLDLDLSNSEEKELANLEEEIYKLN